MMCCSSGGLGGSLGPLLFMASAARQAGATAIAEPLLASDIEAPQCGFVLLLWWQSAIVHQQADLVERCLVASKP